MSYSAPSQIAARQLEYFDGKHVLLAGELEDSFATELLGTAASVSIFTTNLAYANQMQRFDNIDVQFGEQYQAQPNVDMVLLYWPKAKAEAEFLLSMLMAALGQGTEIVVVGENRSGVKSIEKMFASYGRVTKFDSARRCSFYWGQCDNTPAPFTLEDWFKSYPLNVGEQSLTIRSLPGVFSHGELDAGTQLLLDTLPALSGSVFDFGCGAGVIGATIKLRFPKAQITMADISALAVASARETLRFNNLDGEVLASDVYSAISGKFDNIVSNPPFHAGLKTHYAATERFLQLAPQHLNRQGQLMIVANSFLRYPPFIEEAFGHCNTPAKNNKFAIYQAVKNS
ncbi:16S rRNA (guanine(1207)-N(2))-methyltransferase RsmC [Enterovibrio paralichthyis]|uniref:16S rRNA (guanine(1207)-N(2))-methyltransferase RsmC n=1 Tax=Enterovibrio paralichthyis TaxID=2853805 RepID=UPI001C448EDD|nr:16S rRNA (guanine(1207)-N(2))-methyltransferase RsmC [Enterovibrio paralichthyis]MBV7300009.1 16S rRNA (guanine(1207)-N(2))-methyltransferase RsmC [Enterovibrio paralichthyis]